MTKPSHDSLSSVTPPSGGTLPTVFVPATAALAVLLAAQAAGIAVADTPSSGVRATMSISWRASGVSLVDELAAFHQRLATSQIEVPEEVASVLRSNLWDLYE